MHSFGITENYFIIVEQPLSLSVIKMAKCQMNDEPISTCLKWQKNENVSEFITYYYYILIMDEKVLVLCEK